MEELITVPRPRGRPPLSRPVEEKGKQFGPQYRPSTPISRFTLSDLPEWGEWLFMRLDTRWPGRSPIVWKNRIGVYSGNNDYLFIKNADSVLLFECCLHPMDDKPEGREIFVWSRHAEKIGEKQYGVNHRSDAQYSMMSLYRFARDWLTTKGAKYGIGGVCTDCTIGGLAESLKAENPDWVLFK